MTDIFLFQRMPWLSCFLALILSAGDVSRAESTVCGSAESLSPPEVLEEYVGRGRVAGVISILGDADYRETVSCAGWADVENRVPMATNTLFALFSVSKLVTGAALMCAVDDGLLSLDDPVSKYLPEYRGLRMKDGGRPVRELTLRDVTSHVDGMRWEQSFIDNGLTVREAARKYAEHALEYPPGTTFAYGTMRFTAAAACLEVVAGVRFEDYLARRILVPLGMRDTTFTPSAEQLSRLVKAYSTDDGPLRPAADNCARQLVFPKHGPLMPAPGAGLFSTPADMMRFAQMLAHHGRWHDATVISRKTFDEVFSVVQVPGELGGKNPYCVGSWLYGDWFGHEGAMRSDVRVNLKTGHSRLFFIQTENRAGKAFFELKRDWHRACDAVQGTQPTVFGN